MLGGHVDDMEADWTRPIVSIRSSLFLHVLFIILLLKDYAQILSQRVNPSDTV